MGGLHASDLVVLMTVSQTTLQKSFHWSYIYLWLNKHFSFFLQILKN